MSFRKVIQAIQTNSYINPNIMSEKVKYAWTAVGCASTSAATLWYLYYDTQRRKDRINDKIIRVD